MARMPRLAVAGQPHLLKQCGKTVRPVFADDTDRRAYLDALVEAVRVDPVAVHAYALLDDGVWLLATPDDAKALGRFMQRVNRRYVPAFHRRHGTRGALWAGRFQAAALEPERYLLLAMLFVEQAAVRAGSVASAAEWVWSSAGHHLGTRASSLITDHKGYWLLGNTPFEREARHALELRQGVPEECVGELQMAVRSGRPLGSAAFIEAISQASGRSLEVRPRGRPRSSGAA